MKKLFLSLLITMLFTTLSFSGVGGFLDELNGTYIVGWKHKTGIKSSDNYAYANFRVHGDAWGKGDYASIYLLGIKDGYDDYNYFKSYTSSGSSSVSAPLQDNISLTIPARKYGDSNWEDQPHYQMKWGMSTEGYGRCALWYYWY